MTIAILTVSSLSLVASAGSLFIMARTAKKLDVAGEKVRADVEQFKAKTDRNVRRIKTALAEWEI